MAFIYDLTDTWNAGGVTFNAIKMNVTDTASAAASRLVSLQVGGSERFSVDKAGNVLIGNGGDLLISSATGGNNSTIYNDAQDLYVTTNGSTRMYINSSGNVGIGNSSPGTRLDVTGNIRLSDSTPTIELNADGPLIYSPAGNTFAIASGGGIGAPVERMRITSAGNVGIGTSSPTSVGGFTTCTVNGTNGSWSEYRQNEGFAFRVGTDSSIGGFLYHQGAHPIRFLTNNSERMRITSGGELLVGTTTVEAGGRVCSVSTASNDSALTLRNSAGSGSILTWFVNSNNTAVIGSISNSGDTGVGFNNLSDYRLKTIDGPIQNSGAYIDALRPVQGSWKVNGSRFIGLIAHEVQEVSETQIATGEKDGKEIQAMDYSAPEIIANLIAELQSLRARVAQLEGK